MSTQKYPDIDKVAIYLRLSRQENDEDDVLEKHRNQLLDFVRSYGWKFDMFQEIGSSDDIEFRFEFKRLLEKVYNGEYDAVIVVEFDRITRGDSYDYGYIKRMFSAHKTKIITPYDEVIDLSNEMDVMMDMKATMGRYEYLQIRKRLKEGKLRSARMGNWINGPPPLGFDYNSKTKKLTINEEEADTIRELYSLYYDKKLPLRRVATELNTLGKRTKGGYYFVESKVYKYLTNPVYIGTLVYGRTEGSGHLNKKHKKLRKKAEDEWTVVTENAHPAIISREYFDKVQLRIIDNKRFAMKARGQTFALTGLLRCSCCGASSNFIRKEMAHKRMDCFIRKCISQDAYGVKCPNKGARAMYVLDAIQNRIEEYLPQLLVQRESGENDSVDRLKKQISEMNDELIQMQKGIERIKSLFIDGMIDKVEMNKKHEEQNKRIKEKKEHIRNKEKELAKASTDSLDEKIKLFEEAKNNFNLNDPFSSKNNELLKSIIEVIYYKKVSRGQSAEIELNIVFK